MNRRGKTHGHYACPRETDLRTNGRISDQGTLHRADAFAADGQAPGGRQRGVPGNLDGHRRNRGEAVDSQLHNYS
jgi:hypothetical protein